MSGNAANLIAIFRNRIGEKEVPAGVTERIAGMQVRVEESLRRTEQRLKSGSADTETACRWALDMMDAIDEGLVVELLGYLFPKSPAATRALKERTVAQAKELVNFISARTKDPELRRRGEDLHSRARKIEMAPPIRLDE
jgi:hypothetical protein